MEGKISSWHPCPLSPRSLGSSELHTIPSSLTPCSHQAHRDKFMLGTKGRCETEPSAYPEGGSTLKTLPQPLSGQPHFSETSQAPGRRPPKHSLLPA